MTETSFFSDSQTAPPRSLPQEKLAASPRSASWDCLFLTVVVAISSLPYLGRLGFYAGDWMDLANVLLAKHRALIPLYQALFPRAESMKQRPVQLLYLTILHLLFGLDPLGYQIVNTVVLLIAVALFALALRELGMPRIVVISVPLVYALLPNYASDRFWVQTDTATLSMALCFLSLYARLRAVRRIGISAWGWVFDLAGALRVIYQNPTIRAGVLLGPPHIGSGHVVISIDRTQESYRYGSNLLLYDDQSRVQYRVTSPAVICRYLRSHTPGAACSPGFAWTGRP